MGDFPTLPPLKDLPFDATSQVLFECGKVSTDSTCYKHRFVMHVNVFDDYENCKENSDNFFFLVTKHETKRWYINLMKSWSDKNFCVLKMF